MLLENLDKYLTVLNLALCRLNDGKRPCGRPQMIEVLRVVGCQYYDLIELCWQWILFDENEKFLDEYGVHFHAMVRITSSFF